MKSSLRSIGLWAAWLAAMLCMAPVRAAESDKAVPEYAMKAVYLYNFAQLTDWPASMPGNTQDMFTVCVFGQDELVIALEKLRGKTVNGKPLKVVRIGTVPEIKQCQMLYVGEGEGERGGRLFQSLRGTPVLTVTDDPLAARQGAMLQIVPDERRLAFEVDLDAANQAQLRMSSKLLRLAKRVSGQ
jgi:hypothetical protein